jgi:zinc and cadmium transporter
LVFDYQYFRRMILSPNPWVGSMAAVAIVSGLPLVVTLLMARRELAVRRLLPQLTALGAGAVLGAAVAHLIPEAIASGQALASVAGFVAVGFVAFWGIERALAGHDHAHAHGVALGAPSAHDSASSEASCEHLPKYGATSHSHHRAKMLVPIAFAGDAAHNLVDGMLIAAGFLASPEFGFLTLFAVALHELPREVGTFSLFVHGGVRPMRAVAYNAITAVIAMAGAAVTLLVGSQITAITAWLLPIAAGAFLYIAQAVGRASLHDEHEEPVHWGRLGWSVTGLGLMVASAAFA